ncbi:MAG: LuxR C-terminal-related transcriptional regulator [Oscillospiraceae bacterium]|nr:LuxR C-terminal-related transcriptional regulator [Oscillospiraceae bacterium]
MYDINRGTATVTESAGAFGVIPFYYSERLRKKFEILAMSKAAIIEAPFGGRDAIAVCSCLEDADAHGEAVYRFTAQDEAPDALYRRLCRKIEKIDSLAGKCLQEIDFPNALTIGGVCDALRSIRCERKTWLVIDNFHFLLHAMPIQVLAALLSHNRGNFRIVAITQMLGNDGKLAEDLEFYAQMSDYEMILSLDPLELTSAKFGDKTFHDIAILISQDCPPDIRQRHPLSMLHVAWAIRLNDDGSPSFKAIMAELDESLPKNGKLRAEWLLLSAYLHFPNLEKMLPIVRAAEAMFEGGGSQVILPQAPWAFYEHLQLNAFHLGVGEADREADMLEEFLSIYTVLTDGHGSGADALYRAELAFLRCEAAKAEVLAYKAAFLAEGKNQKIVQLGATRLLSSIAIIKADAEGWKHALSEIERAANESVQVGSALNYAIDVVRGALLSDIRDFANLADWLKNTEFLSWKLPAPIKKNAAAVHVLYLMNQGDFARLVGFCQAIPKENFTVFSEYFQSFLMAVGFSAIGDRTQAAKYLEFSVKKALPDGMLHYFAGFSRPLHGLPDEIIEKGYPELLPKFNEHKGKYHAGWKSLHNTLTASERPSLLTERELEIAKLAADGMRNHEIADMLFVSENTVRAHLRSVYQKLDIDRRAKLAKALE